MKIIKLLFFKYALSFIICLLSSFIVFFIFSLISNLGEEYSFNTILKLSVLNSFQILTFVPLFIFLFSVILFSTFLRSKNEIIIIKSYLNIKKLMIVVLPIVLLFSIFEINKNNMALFLENNKLNLIQSNNVSKAKILINQVGNKKTYTILKNLDLNNLENTEYRSYDIYNRQINMADFSAELSFSNNTITLNNYTQYNNNVIEDNKTQKKIKINLVDLMLQSSLVKDLSLKNSIQLDVKLFNFLIFLLLILSYIFLNFFSVNYLSTKQSFKIPILIGLSMLIYAFLIFNNSFSSYKLVYEILASMLVTILFLRTYAND